MVKGLDIFRDHFRSFSDRYILIGGTACDLAMNVAGIPFRVTRDLDIVLCVEALDSSYVNAFWDFVRAGKYETQQQSTGKKQFYRFIKPGDKNFPAMLELFSRTPDALVLSGVSPVVTPIPVDEDASSLSAILLNTDYYNFIISGKTVIEDLPVIGADRLVPLKAKAWLDLSDRKKRGEVVDGKTIKKHKHDIFRLYQIIEPTKSVTIPQAVANDLRTFIEIMRDEPTDFKSLGLGSTSVDSILDELKSIYAL